MPDAPRPQDADASKPEVDADQERRPTPVGQTDRAVADGDPGPSTGSLADDEDGGATARGAGDAT